MNWYAVSAVLVLVLFLLGLLADERAAHERTKERVDELREKLWILEARAKLLRGRP